VKVVLVVVVLVVVVVVIVAALFLLRSVAEVNPCAIQHIGIVASQAAQEGESA